MARPKRLGRSRHWPHPDALSLCDYWAACANRLDVAHKGGIFTDQEQLDAYRSAMAAELNEQINDHNSDLPPDLHWANIL